MSTIGTVTELTQALSSLDYFLPDKENDFGLKYRNLLPQELLALHAEAILFTSLHELTASRLVNTIYLHFPNLREKYPNWEDFLGGYELSWLTFHGKLEGIISSSDGEMLMKYGTSLRVLKDREWYKRAQDLVEWAKKIVENVRDQVEEIEQQRKAEIYTRWLERWKRLHARFPKTANLLWKIL